LAQFLLDKSVKGEFVSKTSFHASSGGQPGASTDLAKQAFGPIAGNRWIQLIAGLIAMIVISNYQYAFTLFAPGIQKTLALTPPQMSQPERFADALRKLWSQAKLK